MRSQLVIRIKIYTVEYKRTFKSILDHVYLRFPAAVKRITPRINLCVYYN